MKYLAIIILLFVAFWRQSAYGQEIEANFVGFDQKKVTVFFSPKIKSYGNVTYFCLKLDSVSVPALDQQIWNVVILLHIKTGKKDFYVQKRLIYPINKSWDTTINGKLIGYEIQSVNLEPSKQLTGLIERINYVDSIVSVFPQCFSDQELKQLHEAFNQLVTDSAGRNDLNKVNIWFSEQLAKIGHKFIEKDCPVAGLELLNNALIYNPSNNFANFILAKLYFSSGQYFESYMYLKRASQKISADYYRQVIDLSTGLAEKFIDLGLNTTDLTKSFEYFCMADTLRSLFTLDLQGFDEKFKQRIQQYFDFKAKNLLDNSNSLELELFISQFVDLTKLYKNYEQYLGPGQAREIDRIFDSLLNRINAFIAQGNYSPGLKHLNTLSEIDQVLAKNSYSVRLQDSKYQGHILYANYLLKVDSLPQAKKQLQIAQKLYFDENSLDSQHNAELLRKRDNDLMHIELTIIDHYMKKKQFDSALASLNWLKNAEFNLLSPQKLDSLKNAIIASYAVFMLDTLQYAPALNIIEKFILKHHLTENQQIWNKYLQKLSLFDQQCQQKHLKFFKTFSIVDSLLEKRQFWAAKDTMELYFATRPQCFINSDTIQKFLQYYRIPIIYQNLTDSYHNYLRNKNYQLAYNTLTGLTQYFYENKLENYGFEPPDLYKMINQQDTAFVKYAIYRLTQDDSLDLALKLLQTLHQKHLPAKQVKNLQAQLGYRLALYDFLLSPQQKPWQSLKKHLRRRSIWYLPLIKAYFKQRKKMKAFKF